MNEPKRRRATRREPVIDDFHGTPVADPYRWLENDTAPEVQAWIDGQNGDFEAYMAGIGGRDRLKERIKSLVHYTRCDAPAFVAGVYYVWRNDGLQNQAVLYRMKTLDDAGELVLDPNLLSTDGTVAISAVSFSPKGNFLAYGLSEGGSDWQTMKVLDLKTGQDRPDMLLHLKFSEASWLADESGFVYTRYPKPDEASVLERQTLNAMVFFHRLGTGQDADLLIHKDDEHPDWLFRAHSDEDKKWLFLSTDYGTLPKNRLHFRRFDRLAERPGDPWLAIADNFDEGWNVVGVIGDTAFIQTKKEAPFGRIVSVPLSESGAGEMTTVIPDRGEELDWAVIVGGRLLCAYLH
ncbi:MAG: hypothetical protein FWD94_05625, partial [Treponema sp.]|nr:hypothetical protein [Treponema sp.]